jgi:hypothetical protein
MNPIKIRCNLEEASRCMEVYYWTNNDFHLHNARSALSAALEDGNARDTVCRVVSNTIPLTAEKDTDPLTAEKDTDPLTAEKDTDPLTAEKKDCIELIKEAMDSVHDMDVTFDDYANAIYKELRHKFK